MIARCVSFSQAEQVLRSGKELSGRKLIQLITEKLHSPGVAHYGTVTDALPHWCLRIILPCSGYILDCFPVTEEMSIDEQLAYICSLELNPSVIINLKVCTYFDTHIPTNTRGG